MIISLPRVVPKIMEYVKSNIDPPCEAGKRHVAAPAKIAATLCMMSESIQGRSASQPDRSLPTMLLKPITERSRLACRSLMPSPIA